MKVDFEEIVKSINERARANYGETDGDYVADDGLLYCGKCHTPKQCVISIKLEKGKEVCKPLTVYTPCKCVQEAQAEAERKRKAEERTKRVEELYDRSLMARQDRNRTFDTSDGGQNEKSMAICRRYTERFPQMLRANQGLLLWGEPGTGKTHAALCIANALLQDCVSVLMVSVPELLRTQPQEWLTERLQRVKLLILDDIGAERGSEYALERVYDTVDTRYRTGLPVVYTSNISLAEMQSTTDIRQRRIYERVLENCYPVHFAGQSRRKAEARRKFETMQEILEGK